MILTDLEALLKSGSVKRVLDYKSQQVNPRHTVLFSKFRHVRDYVALFV
jgi:hypothetical protein